MALASGCAGRPEAPILQRFLGSEAAQTKARLDALLPADVLLIGEQHDARAHHQIEQELISILAGRGLLGAIALEMADAGTSTARLKPSATEEQARQALQWDNKSWPWAHYEPAVMTAVRAGVPVLGANLPRSQMPGSMADRTLDTRLPEPALQMQQQAIRSGHCGLLPESQVSPMTRLQIAKDITMAETIRQVALPGKVVVLLAGSGHVNRTLGVPQHLQGDLKFKAVGLQAGQGSAELAPAFDSVWITPALPDKDHCARLQEQLSRRGS
ncbi:MAG: ChaN family lipoprotein [Pseudomonadota bacterium]|nr:ChaN family lipoprotein [Pseudomonadota bacterium]